jgi:hypothetical protein
MKTNYKKDVWQIETPDLHKMIQELGELEMISARELAKLRIEDRRKRAMIRIPFNIFSSTSTAVRSHCYSAEDSNVLTREGWIYSPDWNYALLVRDSPALKNSELATNQHRLGNPFYLEKIDLHGQEVLRVNPDSTEIPVLRMDEEEVPSFLFGDLTKDYGYYLKHEAGRDSIFLGLNPLSSLRHYERPFCLPNAILSLMYSSMITCFYSFSYHEDERGLTTFGIKPKIGGK